MIRKGYNVFTSVIDAIFTAFNKVVRLVILVAVITSVLTAGLITLGYAAFGR